MAVASAAAIVCNWRACQAWKLAVAGVSVSVTVAIGMPVRLGLFVLSRFTSGVVFWLL